jgi:spore coat polysaccharide biosynthesis protein SpsF
MGSTRLPGKVLEPIAGRPALARIAERLRAVAALDDVAVLTSVNANDEPIVELCRAERIHCVRGSEQDVLDRFHQAAKVLGAERIVRVTADCPLIDPEVVGWLLELAAERPDAAYASVATGAIGSGRRRYPDGLDAETFTAATLATAWTEATDPYEREHVTPFIWRRPERSCSRLCVTWGTSAGRSTTRPTSSSSGRSTTASRAASGDALAFGRCAPRSNASPTCVS